MKWLHLSDIHFIANCTGGNTRLILDSLLNYLDEKNIHAEDLFITGDFRFAKTQKESRNQQVATQVAEYIWEVAHQLNIVDERHIHIVPGNHDLNREKGLREDIVHGIYPKYQQNIMNGDVDEAVLTTLEIKQLVSAFTFFRVVLDKLYSAERAKNIWDSMQKDVHYYDYDCNPYFNILYMNTAIMSVEKSEDEKGKLVVSHTHLHKALCKMRKVSPTNHKPVIVLAHHPLDYLDSSERVQLEEKYFYDYGVYVYLSGHSHISYCLTKNDNYLFVNQGGLRTEKGAQISFGIGEYNPLNERVSVKSHEYRDGSWGLSPHFGVKSNSWLVVKSRTPNPYSAKLKVPISDIDKGFAKSINEAKKDFIKSLTTKPKTSAISYLLAGLSHLDFWSDKLTPQLFYNEFYVSLPPSEEDKNNDKISELFNDIHHNMLCLKGWAGSGKSTYIKTMAVRGFNRSSHATYYRYHVLDCAETEGINLRHFPCTSIKKQIKNELRRMNKASRNNGTLWETYFMNVLANIITLHDDTKDDRLSEFTDYINYVRQQIKEHGTQRYSFLANKLAGEENSTQHNPWTQLGLFLIILVCKNCLFEKDEQRKHIIVFDNIEQYIDHVATPVPDVFYNANTSLKRLFAFLNERNVFSMPTIPITKPEFMKDFTFIICARFTTRLRTVHAGHKIFGMDDKYIVEREFHDFTVEALLRKLKFLKQNVSRNTELVNETEKIIQLLITKGCIDRYLEGRDAKGIEKDEDYDVKIYSAQKYLPLFNNDFRKAIRALELMYKKEYKGKTWMEYALSFPQYDYSAIGNIKINAARMVLLKNIIDHYVDKGFLDTMGFESNIDNGQQSHSVARMIISFLYWQRKNKKQTELAGVPICDVVNIFKNTYNRNVVIDALVKLSLHVDPKDKAKDNLLSGWGYFIDILDYENTNIKNSLAKPINDKTTTVRLTPAGLCMAWYVILQFEFFSARIPMNAKIPLVLFDNHSDGTKYDFEKTIDSVYASVNDFLEGLLNNINVPHCDNRHRNCETYISLNEFLDVVMEHILYIDRVRMLQWDISPSDIINKRMLIFIKKYFELLNKINNSSKLPEKCKSASVGFMMSRDSRTIDYKGITIYKIKLESFLKEETGGLWSLKEDSLFEHLKTMTF